MLRLIGSSGLRWGNIGGGIEDGDGREDALLLLRDADKDVITSVGVLRKPPVTMGETGF